MGVLWYFLVLATAALPLPEIRDQKSEVRKRATLLLTSDLCPLTSAPQKWEDEEKVRPLGLHKPALQ
jgi:hypothetical protein